MSEDQSTVLLVEDDPHIRLFVSELLEDAGFRVLEATNASEALAVIHAGRTVDVLLTDVDLASADDGFELARTVCKSFSDIEILILTGRQWPSSRDLSAHAALLRKPCPNQVILEGVQAAAHRSKRQKSSTSSLTEYGSTTVSPRSQNRLGA